MILKQKLYLKNKKNKKNEIKKSINFLHIYTKKSKN